MQVFISYSRQDFNHALALHEALEAAGHDAWLDLEDIEPGMDWQEAIFAAIADCELCVLLVSPWSLGSPNVQVEWERAAALGKTIVLAVVESAAMTAAHATLQDRPWLDVRRHPLRIGAAVLGWLSDETLARSGPPPAPPPRWLFWRDPQPAPAKLLGWTLLLGSVALIGAVLRLSLHLLDITDGAPVQDAVFGDALIMLLMVVNVLIALYALATGRSGLRVLRRRHSGLVGGMGDLLYLYGVLAALYTMIALSYVFDTLTQVGASSAMASLMLDFALFFDALTVLLYLVWRWLKRSPALKQWQPSYAAAQVALRELEARVEAAVLAGEVNAPMTRIAIDGPPRVLLLAAPQDALFARGLAAAARAPGVTVEVVVPAAGQEAIDPGRYNVAVIVLSPWSMRNPAVEAAWRAASDAGLPIVPVQLQDTDVPDELAELNWLDSRTDFPHAREALRRVLRGEDFPMRTVAPERTGDSGIPKPKIMRYAQYYALLVGLFKPVVLMLLFPLLVWNGATPAPETWVLGTLLAGVGYGQSLLAGALARRGVSLGVFLAGQVGLALAAAALWTVIWPLFHPFLGLQLLLGASEATVRLVFSLSDVALIGVFLLVPTIRQWMAGGVVLLPGKIRWEYWVALPVVCVPILLVLVLSVGNAEDHALTYNQPVTGTISMFQWQARYDFTGQAGDQITISMDATSGNLDCLLLLLDDAGNILGEDDDGGADYNSRLVMTLPYSGPYQVIATRYAQHEGASNGGYTLRVSHRASSK